MMPLINDQSDRPGCMPSLKDEPFLPSIKSLPTPKSDRGFVNNNNNNNSNSNNNNNNNSNNSNNNNNNNFNKENKSSRDYHKYNGSSHQDAYNASLKPYSSAPASESSTPFKLPTIDRTESNSVASLFSDRHLGHKGKGRSRGDRRARLCRSPSCPSLASYWGEHPESPRSTRLNDSTEHAEGHTRPFFTHRDDDGIKLPSIYNSRKTTNSSFTLTSSTANSSTHTSRDTSPFNFKREATFMSLLHQEQQSQSSTHPASPQHAYDGDNNMSRSSTQSSALLLPISSCHDSQTNGKSKRKRKKHTGLLVSSEDGSEAEKLLREKLGAIERRDLERSSPPRHHESEKTDLSDTAFIDKVKDETNLANGAPEPLASKPPVYQNTPARIKTEKKVAPVKA